MRDVQLVLASLVCFILLLSFLMSCLGLIRVRFLQCFFPCSSPHTLCFFFLCLVPFVDWPAPGVHLSRTGFVTDRLICDVSDRSTEYSSKRETNLFDPPNVLCASCITCTSSRTKDSCEKHQRAEGRRLPVLFFFLKNHCCNLLIPADPLFHVRP